jgi:hypothetical protein
MGQEELHHPQCSDPRDNTPVEAHEDGPQTACGHDDVRLQCRRQFAITSSAAFKDQTTEPRAAESVHGTVVFGVGYDKVKQGVAEGLAADLGTA